MIARVVAQSWLALLLPALDLYAEPWAVGEARSYRGDDLLYREFHYRNDDGLRWYIEYRDMENRLIADKTLDYSTGQTTPEFVQRNYRSDRELSVRWRNGNLVLSEGKKQKRVATQTPDTKSLVIDAGFDAFIRRHWEQLVAGERVQFHFPMPSRLRLLALQANAVDCGYSDSGEQCFSLRLSGWLLHLLAEPIELGYDPVSKRLRRYRGLSNLEDQNGKGFLVDIRYRYPHAEKAPAAE